MRLTKLRVWARQVKQEAWAVYLALRDPRTPWAARILGALVVAYLFSPFDLIPDFVPILGYVDDVLIVPFGLWLTIRLIPADVMQEMRARAETERPTHKPVIGWGGALVIGLWVVGVALGGWWFWQWWR